MSDIALAGTVRVTTSRDAAFAAFYEQHIHQLTRTLSASLGNAEIGAEAAQEAMARACERWNSISHYDNPAGWCYRVGMNWATSRWRKRRREVLTDEQRASGAVSLPDVELQDQMRAALLGLSVEHRAVIVLRLVEDWSIAETADALGIAEGTVQSRYARALKRLRELVGEEHD